jgi:hypothetical protein
MHHHSYLSQAISYNTGALQVYCSKRFQVNEYEPWTLTFSISLLKGTVARDFLSLGFSTNRPHIVPEFKS